MGVYELISAFVVFDPEVGYCRGMCNIAAFLLGFLMTRLTRLLGSRAFIIFICLMRHFGLAAGFAPGVHALRSKRGLNRAKIFEMLLKGTLPDLASRFTNLNLNVSTTVAPWVRTALTDFHVFSPVVVSRIWDFVFLHLRLGEEMAWLVLYKVLLAVFNHLSQELLKSSLEESLRMLWDLENQKPNFFETYGSEMLSALVEMVGSSSNCININLN